MGKEQQPRDIKKEKQLRHQDNVEHLTGFWHGTYFIDGIAKVKEKPQEKVKVKITSGG